MSTRTYILSGLKIIILTLVLGLQAGSASSENLRSLVNLKGYWKFSVGDDPARAKPNFNDSKWEKIFVPQSWEHGGFEGYNGYAWYRKHFTLSIPNNLDFVYLYVGYIDDADEVYVNGQLVGTTGQFPPKAETAYDIPRMYPVPSYILNSNGDNIIAIRVFDDFHEGGIINGNIEIAYDLDQKRMNLDLSGYWNFESSIEVDSANKSVITSKLGKIFVPGFWEARGYNNYNGKAVYSKEFKYPFDLNRNDQVLFMGVIDDVDEVYLNGQKIGSVRDMKRKRFSYAGNHLTLRAYEIPDNLLKHNSINSIEVIVEDFSGPGGIYKGPIGIIGENEAMSISKKSFKDTRSPFQKLIDYWFD
ncbi:beta galactosidase jelly roll domain-containing protein [Marinifilum sp. RC60d5]|uniref:beta galactosidase jelly roll domain-containing protein n=1 Tax=Marinifilum sp. RC60d5 TaxID=3458414 RepID=UPI004035BA85